MSAPVKPNASLTSKENAGLGMAPSTSSKGLAPRPLGSQSANGPRRALGNITNIAASKPAQPSGSHKAEPVKPAQSASTSKPSGRAFGTVITKPYVANTSQSTTQPSVKARPAPPEDLASQYARHGVERPAGKTWAQQEAERAARKEQLVNQRVQAACASFASWKPSLVRLSHDTLTALCPRATQLAQGSQSTRAGHAFRPTPQGLPRSRSAVYCLF